MYSAGLLRSFESRCDQSCSGGGDGAISASVARRLRGRRLTAVGVAIRSVYLTHVTGPGSRDPGARNRTEVLNQMFSGYRIPDPGSRIRIPLGNDLQNTAAGVADDVQLTCGIDAERANQA